MDFTDLFKSSLQPRPSPSSLHILTVVAHRLVIRSAKTLQITNILSCPAPILHASWSPLPFHSRKDVGRKVDLADRMFGVLCYGSNWWYVWGGQGGKECEWDVKVEDSFMKSAEFSPCGRFVLVWSEFGLRLSIWNLLTSKVVWIRNPKIPGWSFFLFNTWWRKCNVIFPASYNILCSCAVERRWSIPGVC